MLVVDVVGPVVAGGCWLANKVRRALSGHQEFSPAAVSFPKGLAVAATLHLQAFDTDARVQTPPRSCPRKVPKRGRGGQS